MRSRSKIVGSRSQQRSIARSTLQCGVLLFALGSDPASAQQAGDGAASFEVELRGQVVLAGGMAPVKGAAVIAADSASGTIGRTFTTSEGRFTLRLPVAVGDQPVIAIGAAADGFGRAGPLRLRPADRRSDVMLVLRGDDSTLFPEMAGELSGFELRSLTDGERLIVGSVREADTARPIAAALVKLTDPDTGESVTTTSTADGRFSIEPPTWQGSVSLEVAALGYATAEPAPIELDGEPVFVSATLRAEAVELAGLEVSVSRSEPILERWGVLDRAGRGFGQVFMGPKLEAAVEAAMGRPSALFWRIPGTTVQRGEPSFMRGNRFGSRSCRTPDLFVNGALARSGMPSLVDITFDDAVGIHPQNIIAVETYPNAATVPGDFRHRASDCGAILVWTR